MSSKLFACTLAAAVLVASCHPDASKKAASDSIATPAAPALAITDPDPTDTVPAHGYAATSSNIDVANMLKAKLVELLADDLKKMTDNDRKFKYHAFDLNRDGKPEYFVTIPSPYFCDSAGCTSWIFTNDGKLLSKFTVMDFPIYVTAKASEGYYNLIMSSNDKWHHLKMHGGTYPSNPSVAPLYKGDLPKRAPAVLNIHRLPYPEFAF